jgi:hypothetical protein
MYIAHLVVLNRIEWYSYNADDDDDADDEEDASMQSLYSLVKASRDDNDMDSATAIFSVTYK